MFQVQHTVMIPRASERVWAVIEDLPAWPKWCRVITAARWLTEGQWRRGARAAIIFRLRNKRVTVHAEVTTIDPPRRLAWAAHGFGVTRRHRLTLEPEEHLTRVTATETFSGPLLFLRRLALSPAWARGVLVGWLDALSTEAQR
jgi:hypothetical protein